jgi:predicted MFS family arabinose efflux permease
MGAVMGAFSLAAVLGVPIGLELARLGGWRLPFFAVAGLGFATIMAALALLPPQRGHLDAAAGPGAIRLAALFGRRQVWVAYGLAGLPLLQVFMIIPNISAYVQFNLGLPRARLGLLYLIGGGLSFFGMRLAGRLVDRCGATPVTLALTLLLSLVIYLGYVDYAPAIPVLALFPCFMLVSSGRMVATGSTLTKVAEPGERAGFMSVVSAVQNLASAAGSFLAAQLLTTAADGSLRRMPLVALISIAIGLAVPGLMAVLEGSLRRRVAAPMRAIDIA